MKTVAVIAFVLCAVAAVPVPDQEQGPVHAESPESQYLGLPAGADSIVGKIDITFSCADRDLGYYADIGNDCKIFHVCNPIHLGGGQFAAMQYSFVCPNGTLFDQQTFTCTVPPGTAPCVQAESFYYLNRHVGQAGPESVPVASPPVQAQPQLQRPAVVPEPKHEAPVHQQQLVPPAPSKPSVGDDSVIRPASYYGGKSS